MVEVVTVVVVVVMVESELGLVGVGRGSEWDTDLGRVRLISRITFEGSYTVRLRLKERKQQGNVCVCVCSAKLEKRTFRCVPCRSGRSKLSTAPRSACPD